MTGSGADWSAASVLTEHFLDVTQSKGHAETHPLPDWELGPGRPASAGLRLAGGRSAGRRRGAPSAAAGSLWKQRGRSCVTTATELSGQRWREALDRCGVPDQNKKRETNKLKPYLV